MRMYPILIHPDEAVSMRSNISAQQIFISKDIFDAYIKQRGNCCYFTHEEMFEFFCMLSCVYNAGRVQGIREERQIKKAKNTRNHR